MIEKIIVKYVRFFDGEWYDKSRTVSDFEELREYVTSLPDNVYSLKLQLIRKKNS